VDIILYWKIMLMHPDGTIVKIFGPDRARGLPVFHNLMLPDCGQGKGKVTAWDIVIVVEP
jgi:hypothetical protein